MNIRELELRYTNIQARIDVAKHNLREDIKELEEEIKHYKMKKFECGFEKMLLKQKKRELKCLS